MLTTATLTATLVLAALPGFLHFGGSRKATTAAPADTLPPPWKTSSRLDLEERFVPLSLQVMWSRNTRLLVRNEFDPRRLRVRVDPDSGIYSTSIEGGDVPLRTGARLTLQEYTRVSMRESFRRQWADRSRSQINSLGANTPAQRSGLSFQLPSPLPRRVQSLLGPGGPALNVSGSESIRLSGQSNWTNQQTGLLGQRRSLFPTLDMQQDLDIRLEGQLSDRIKVNLLQNSANQIPLANRIAINYRGDEDDVVQALDLGNTNLSLPGTQYVSYSGKNEGLFGVKVATRVGPLDVTALASKQEGRSERASYAGGASRSTHQMSDFDYARGQYFLLYDPNFATFDVPDSSIRIYLDDYNYNNDVGGIRGRALIDPGGTTHVPLPAGGDSASWRGVFKQLQSGSDRDYEILRDVYSFENALYRVIRLKQPIDPNSNQCLAASFLADSVADGTPLGTTRIGGDLITTGPDSGLVVLKMLRPPRQLQRPAGSDPDGGYDPDSPFTIVRDLELKNFYQLPGYRIDPATFKLSIRRGRDEPPRTTIPDSAGTTQVPYIEVLGLDNFSETTGTPVRDHDGIVDGTSATSRTRLFVDYENGVLFFLDPRPFAPRIQAPNLKPFDAALSSLLNRRRTLTGPADSTDGANAAIYDKYTVRSTDARYYLDLEFSAARASGEITLGRGNIIEGSDVVTVNGERWVRDRDYTVDYDLGRLSLKKQLGPADQLNVDYSYAPLFQQAGRTLIGSAFRFEGREKSLGGAFMYESKGAQDLRPRLGEEPSRTLITDLNTDWRFKPTFLTRLADRLPGVRTTAPSEFSVQAEVGSSFPNPNTRNEVFIDDMEGVRDAISLSMGPERWRWSSPPSKAITIDQDRRATVTAPFTDNTSVPNYSDGEVRWYSPPSVVKEKDLRPTLTEAQGSENSRQVLAISVPRRPVTESVNDTLWAGLTYPLDGVGVDLSRSQFLEVWVNDFNDYHDPSFREDRVRGLGVKLHLDLGVVSEDQMRAPNRPPNGRLESEDRPPRDNQLTVTDSNDEDTGVDGIKDTDEISGGVVTADLTTADATTDPEGDDFRSPDERFKEIDPRRYRFTNGYEGNKGLVPVPDTEDLNLNDRLDTQEDYFEYTIDLGDLNARYLVTDVRREFGVADSSNGWRRYRIPLADSARVQFGAPDLTIARHVRLWLEGIQKSDSTSAADRRPLIMLGGVEIVGSRWQATALTPAQRDTFRTTLTLNSVNTVDNAEKYVPPFDPGETRSGNQEVTRREQSIALEFTQLEPVDTLEAYKTFSIDENYSRYGALRWYAAGFDIPGYDPSADTLHYFVRFASDEQGLNYYEIKRRVPRASVPRQIDWQETRIQLAQISGLKLNTDFPKTDPILYRAAYGDPGDSILIRGRPSFTRLRRVSFGLINGSAARRFDTGQLWFDEIRATDVAKDVGLANRVLVGGHVANLYSYNLSWNARDADFLSVGETRGSGSRTTSLSFSSNLDTHRFFEGTGIQLPVNFMYSRNVAQPRFTAGDDVVRTDVQADASETRSTARSVGTSYSRTWSERSNPFLRYTVGGITANFSRSWSKTSSPVSIDSSVTTAAGVNYGVAPRSLLTLGVPRTKLKFYPLPERVFWNYSVGSRYSQTIDRLQDGSGELRVREPVRGRAASIDFGADQRPIDLFHHHIEGRRNLSLGDLRNDRIGFINFGRLVSWRQSMDARYAFRPASWFRPSMSWNSSYNQNNGPELSKDLSLRNIGNGQSMSFDWDLPFDRLTPSIAPALRQAAADTADSAGARPARRRSLALPLRGWLGRIGTLSTSTSLSKTSSYSRVRGNPGPLYLFGLAENPGFEPDSTGRVRQEFGGAAQTGIEWRTRANARLPLVYGSTLVSRFGYGDRTSSANGVLGRSRDWRFPDFEIEYGQIAKVLRLDKLLENPTLRTAFSRAYVVDYANGKDEDARSGTSTSIGWTPMIALNGRFKNGTLADLRIDHRNTTREILLSSNSEQTDANTDVNVTLNRSYSQGQKVNFLGKTTTIRSNVNLQLTTVYSRHKGQTINRLIPNAAPQFPVSEDRLSVNGTGSYGFSNNVTGNVSLGFSQNRDLQREIVRRSVRVEARAQFTF